MRLPFFSSLIFLLFLIFMSLICCHFYVCFYFAVCVQFHFIYFLLMALLFAKITLPLHGALITIVKDCYNSTQIYLGFIFISITHVWSCIVMYIKILFYMFSSFLLSSSTDMILIIIIFLVFHFSRVSVIKGIYYLKMERCNFPPAVMYEYVDCAKCCCSICTVTSC